MSKKDSLILHIGEGVAFEFSGNTPEKCFDLFDLFCKRVGIPNLTKDIMKDLVKEGNVVDATNLFNNKGETNE